MTVKYAIVPLLLKTQNRFKNIILNGGKLNELIQILSDGIEFDIAIIDTKMNNKYLAETSEDYSSFIQEKTVKDIINRFCSYPITHNNVLIAYLVVNKGDNGTNEITESEQALFSLAELPILLLLQKNTEEFYIEKKYRNQLIQDIVFNNITDLNQAEKKASLYGWNLSNMTAVTVFIVSFPNSVEDEIINRTGVEYGCIVENQYPDTIYTQIANTLVFIVSGINEDDIFNKFLENLLSRLNSSCKCNIRIGVGSKKSGVLMTHKSYDDAMTALKIGKKISDNNIYFYNDLGVYKLLSSLHNSSSAEDFLADHLEPLLKYDRENSQDLFDTLAALIENDWDIKLVAEKQYIHYNTVKYRIKKIGDILDQDFSSPENKINLALALKLYHLKS